ncbi:MULTISPECIES: hypothetical protein [Stenotrophomonas]|jgi:hypothetical protein|uniref:hypothetical protein n=1 Tax=Stenotrophomonas TaxID=40323 RepID=UPI001071AF02|nr:MULTISPECIES: hypothetical protein [Stenotrophomonas]MBH1692915.1 hypothetical protein [Stenotrophomonas maltophilia]MBH1816989.1 hypothetical protein [Stenotrophomonas maltophilia]MBN5158346.1 hypothetical protein [Stenotrophomonas maltophilia]MCU1031224.1 hypothetical protein [Stenotrophomonas maltophilia]MDG2510584.1 hypothetical protein [Stenotrophomonas maltophilia]
MKEAPLSAGSSAHREIAILSVFALIILGLSVSATFFIGAFLCVAFIGLKDRKAITIYAALCLGFLALVGAYHVGKDMAKRDAATSSSEMCPAKAQSS